MWNDSNMLHLYWVLLIKMWPVWARLIVAPPARGHLEVTLSVFLDSGGSWSFFVQEIYIKTNVRLSKNTYVFEPSFSDIYFTGWFDFSFIFSFFWFNRIYLWYLVLKSYHKRLFTIYFFCFLSTVFPMFVANLIIVVLLISVSNTIYQ